MSSGRGMPIIYGPVESRRFGISLGVNPLGNEKICSFDCRYCDLGPTEITMSKARKDHVYPSIDDIVTALKASLKKRSADISTITVSGNGEPTLYPEFDQLVAALKAVRNDMVPKAKLAILSNGAHLDSRKVIQGLNELDIRSIKLDAGNDRLMKALNAPLVRRNLLQIVAGLRKLKDCTIQSMFVKGAIDNTLASDIEDWMEMIGMIKPMAIHIYTVTRPPVDSHIQPVDEDALYSIVFKLKKRTQLEAQVLSIK